MKSYATVPVAFAKHAFAAAALLFGAASLPAQIAVNIGPSPVINFSNTPPATEWATHDIDRFDDYGTPAQLDAFAQTLNATSIVTTLPTTTATGTSRLARHNSTLGVLVTQPGGVPVIILMARLRNTSASSLELLQVSYNFSVLVPPITDSIPGQRAYWSLTGLTNTWTSIPELSGVASNATLSALLGVGTWAPGTDLYLLWLDDNNATGQDGAFAIDNVVFTGAATGDITVTDDPDSITVPERGSAAFTVAATGLPRAYYWLRDGVPIPGAHSASYTVPSVVYPGDNGAVFSVIVSNSLGIQTSGGATLTVNPDTNAPVALRAIGDFTRTTVTVSFSEPISPAGFDPSSFQIFPTGTNPELTGVAAMTAVLTNATNIVIGFDPPYTDAVNHSLRLSDVYDTAATPLGVELTILPLHHILQLIDFDGPNNIWSFSTETNLFGTGWEAVNYDDALWPTGLAGLGRDTSANGVPIRTAVYPFNDSAPQFFRRHFYLNADPANTVLSMRHVFEDGAVVYLNGQEAGRFNVGAGALSVTTRTPSFVTDPTPISAPVPLPTTNQAVGDNVIAIVVFQFGDTSSDCEMALELTATITEYANTRRLKITTSGADVVITWNSAGTLEHSTDISNSANWTPVPGSPTSPFTTNTSGSGTFYRLVLP